MLPQIQIIKNNIFPIFLAFENHSLKKIIICLQSGDFVNFSSSCYF